MSYHNQVYYSRYLLPLLYSFCAKPEVDPCWDQNTLAYLLSESELY